MIKTVYAPHGPEAEHLSNVIADMERLGPPTIRAYDAGDHYIALEGSHRLAAAESLGLPVTLDVLRDGDEIDHDFDDVASRRVGDVVAYLADGVGHGVVPYSLEVEIL